MLQSQYPEGELTGKLLGGFRTNFEGGDKGSGEITDEYRRIEEKMKKGVALFPSELNYFEPVPSEYSNLDRSSAKWKQYVKDKSVFGDPDGVMYQPKPGLNIPIQSEWESEPFVWKPVGGRVANSVGLSLPPPPGAAAAAMSMPAPSGAALTLQSDSAPQAVAPTSQELKRYQGNRRERFAEFLGAHPDLSKESLLLMQQMLQQDTQNRQARKSNRLRMEEARGRLDDRQQAREDQAALGQAQGALTDSPPLVLSPEGLDQYEANRLQRSLATEGLTPAARESLLNYYTNLRQATTPQLAPGQSIPIEGTDYRYTPQQGGTVLPNMKQASAPYPSGPRLSEDGKFFQGSPGGGWERIPVSRSAPTGNPAMAAMAAQYQQVLNQLQVLKAAGKKSARVDDDGVVHEASFWKNDEPIDDLEKLYQNKLLQAQAMSGGGSSFGPGAPPANHDDPLGVRGGR